jgi:deoxyribodipyrimidine photo-lyase
MDPLEKLAGDPRVTVRRGGQANAEGRAVVYWMQRAQRAIDNPALETAVRAANLLKKPVVVFVSVVRDYPNANLRSYTFFAEGIRALAPQLLRRGIGFVLRAWPEHDLIRFCDEVSPCLVIGDENPLRQPEQWRQSASRRLRAPFWTIDADVIVPSKLLTKEQYSARTIRPRISTLLDEFLLPVPKSKPHVRWQSPKGLHSLPPDSDFLHGLPISRAIGPVGLLRGGTDKGLRLLHRFLRYRLAGYDEGRNHPEENHTSQLSPYLHFGHLGPHTVALAVKNARAPAADRAAFLEQLIIRRELAINFCRYNPHYDNLACAEPWALRTLRQHARDEREHLYTERQLESAETHDPLWNAAQKQVVLAGWMHGYLRMYWAKKILEWTRSPEEAFAIAVRLNDRYELDGRDPNGYAGIAWAIAGKHDRAWGPERPVYGKIRYMSYQSTSRKFNSKAYISMVNSLAS